MKCRSSCAAAFGLLVSGLVATGAAHAAPVSPPQGYIGFSQDFAGADPSYWDGTQHGFYNYDYDFTLTNTAAEQAGTFWSNTFSFRNSTAGLPANHVGGDQGGYIGVQVKSATESIAIFSVWWATAAQPGAGATCVDEVEMWYNDDKPFEPAITDANSTDASRKVAGGPFRSCRLPITLSPNVRYRLRVWEISDAKAPDAPEWWGAWLINVDTNEEKMIGKVQVPGAWSWLNTSTGGFIEHFGPMPQGCASIPASASTYYPTQADKAAFTATTSAHLYGACKSDLQGRTTISCTAASCDVTIK